MHHSCKQRKYADKPKEILLLDNRFSYIEVVKILLLDDNTVKQGIRNIYLNQDEEPLLTENDKGRISFLNSKQLDTLEKHITENTYMDSKEIVAWIEK